MSRRFPLLLLCGLAGCAEILGLEPPIVDETTSTGGQGGTTSSGGQGGTTSSGGQGGTTSSGGQGGTTSSGGQGGTTSSGGQGGTTSSGGQGGTGGSTCAPKTCVDLAKDCGDVDNGCGEMIPCGACSSGQICGFLVANECGGQLVVRNGFVQSDGLKSLSQTCDVLGDGTVDCGDVAHPFTSFTLQPAGVNPDPGKTLSDRFTSVFVLGSTQKLINGYLQSDGAREWVQTCDLGPNGAFDCAQATHPFVMRPLPPMGLTLDAGTHVGGRYTFVYTQDGVQKLRNGFVQSDGLKSSSQVCDITAAGDLDCEPVAHPFSTFGLPGASFSTDPGTVVSDRYAFLYYKNGSPRLRNGFVQSDGWKGYDQDCDVAVNGTLDCAVATHPFTTVTLPPPGAVPDGGTVFHHRFAFNYMK